MGASLSVRQVPQVRMLAALLETHRVKVSLRQLQRYWNLLLPFNPWLATAPLWSLSTYERLIQRVTSAMEHERRVFPPGLVPTLVAIRACIQGVPSPTPALICEPAGSPPVADADDNDIHSLSAQLEAALELDPPSAPDPGGAQDGALPPSSPAEKGKSSPSCQDGSLPPSSSAGPQSPALVYPPLPPRPPSWDSALPAPPSWDSALPALPSALPLAPFSAPPSYAPPSERPPPQSTASVPAPDSRPPLPPDATPATYSSAPFEPPIPPLAQMYPLNPVRSIHNPQIWLPFPPKDMQLLRTAIKEDGIASPHAQDILERMAIPRCVPYDWISLARSVLTPGQFIDWRAHLGVLIDLQIADNARQGVHYPANAFLRYGPYGDPSAYVALPPGFFIQLRDCVFRAFRSCAAANPEPLTQLFQKPDEPFNEFVARVQAAAERRVGDRAARTSFVKDVLQEGANAACKAIIRPLHERPLQDWVLACAGVTSQTSAIAAAVVAAVQTTNTCFRCGELGHFACECANNPPLPPQHPWPPAPPQPVVPPMVPPPRPVPAARPPSTPCPRCGKGYHWARDCRVPRQPLNGQRGKTQPRHQEAPVAPHRPRP
ncbi:endogenous retrovirus group K member 21 Gag polyprotein-like [Dasypus novemcinctus]|uniref:endogenous retrovirus group K member 21 Gag polyprotein-like n=1 Tax=Dasypus novemcinctus TaxID=9361 RepID=UPI0039C964F1